MASWGAFAAAEPELAAAGQRLFYQFGPGLAFLATVTEHAHPRLHPVMPVVEPERGGLYLFVLPHSPKLADLDAGRPYALHALLGPSEVAEEFSVNGTARRIEEHDTRQAIARLCAWDTSEDVLFELDVRCALHVVPRYPGDRAPLVQRWHARGRHEADLLAPVG